MSNIAVGIQGEDLACAYLERKGWRIEARNWRCAEGELDIIATDAEGVLVFCEVKCRSGRGYGDPLEAITMAKIRKLRQLVSCWLAQNQLPHRNIRLDAIGVLLRRGFAPEISHRIGIGA